MIQSTSLKAFEEIKNNLSPRRKQVYETLKKLGQANDRMLSKYSGIPINVVTPRRGELINLKLVGVSFVGKDLESGKDSIYWKIVR